MAPDTGIAPSSVPSKDAELQAATTPRQLVTGNRLRDGASVYFAGDGRWSTAVEDALHVAPEAGESLLAAALSKPGPQPIVAPYLIDATLTDDRLEPSSLRERIRAYGPTVSYR